MPDPRAKHFLLAGHPGFRVIRSENLRIRCDRCLELAEHGASHPLDDAAGTFGGLDAPTGFARDTNGDVYVTNASACRIDVLRACSDRFEPLPCVGGCGPELRQLPDPKGLAISLRGDLFVVDRGNARVQVFTLKGLALRAVWTRPGWDPFDVLVTPGCTALVSDPAGNRIHVFDARGAWRRAVQTPKPTHLALDRSGNVYVVGEGATPGTTAVRLFDPDLVYLGTVSRVDEAREEFCDVADEYERAAALLGITSFQTPPVFELEGRAWIGPLDSEEYRCEWHRVELHGVLPAGGGIRVDTYTSETQKSDEDVLTAPEVEWRLHTPHTTVGAGAWDCLVRSARGRFLWIRLTLTCDGAHTPSVERVRVEYPRLTSLERLPAVFQETEESRDFLNRYLSILDRTRENIASKVDDFPEYLDPAAVPEAFLGWLAGLMGLSLSQQWPLEKRRKLLRAASTLYRLRGKAAGLEKHLEIYLGLAPRVLEHFKLRRWAFSGAARIGDARLYGKAVAARLELEENSTIGEFQLVDAGDPALDAFNVYAHRFTVVIARALTEVERRSVLRIVEFSKPAHTEAKIAVGDGRLVIGKQSFIGVDTVVGGYPSGVRLGDAAGASRSPRLGQGTVLSPSNDETRAPGWRVGSAARIGAGTVLD